jgi:hypothetical protein
MRKLIYAGLLAMALHSAASAQASGQKPLLINGQVLDAEGRLVAGAFFYAAPVAAGLRGPMPRGVTNAAGKFTVEVRQTGWFVVGGRKPAEGYMRTSNPFYGPSPDSEAHVLVEENRPAPFATVRLRPKGGTLILSATDAETNAPLTNVWLSLCRAEVPKYCTRISAKNPRGHFPVLVPPDPITVQVATPGYKDWVAPGSAAAPPLVVRVDSGGTRELTVSMRKPVQSFYAPAVPELEAPLPLLPVEGSDVDLPFPRVTRVVWSPVSGASSYTVEVDFCMPGGVDGRTCITPYPLEDRKVQPQAGIEGTDYTFPFPGAQPCRWRVWAVDSLGRPGAKSAWANFNYIR